MAHFGLTVVGQAVYDATFSEMIRPFTHALSVTEAAHGVEIILKARIAAEHPLLIFDSLPQPTDDGEMLSTTDLLERGRSIGYSELPAALWRATDYRLGDPDAYKSFGRLWNQIQHLAVPNLGLADETPRFAFQVVQPVVTDFRDKNLLEYACEFDPDAEEYFEERLNALGLEYVPLESV